MMYCECGKISENRDTGLCGSCSRAARKAETDAMKVKKKYVIPKTSPKMKEDLKIYTILRKVFLESKPNCEAKIKDICLGPADQIHHKIGRGENLLNVKTWLAVCFDCHQWITMHPEEAIKLGLSESRLSKK